MLKYPNRFIITLLIASSIIPIPDVYPLSNRLDNLRTPLTLGKDQERTRMLSVEFSHNTIIYATKLLGRVEKFQWPNTRDLTQEDVKLLTELVPDIEDELQNKLNAIKGFLVNIEKMVMTLDKRLTSHPEPSSILDRSLHSCRESTLRPSLTFQQTEKDIYPPALDLSLSKEALFPTHTIIKVITESLRDTDARDNLLVDVRTWDTQKIDITLYYKDELIALLSMQVTDELTLEQSLGTFPKIPEFLIHEATSFEDTGIDPRKRIYKNLKTYVKLSIFIAGKWRKKGIGSRWIELLEDYIFKSGFDVVAIRGSCDCYNPGSHFHFFTRRGFSDPIYPNSMTGYSYIRFKVLQRSI